MTLATIAEADAEWAHNVGRDRPDQAWILSDRDVWYRNHAYRGPPVPHPEDDYLHDDPDPSDSVGQAFTTPAVHAEGPDDDVPF